MTEVYMLTTDRREIVLSRIDFPGPKIPRLAKSAKPEYGARSQPPYRTSTSRLAARVTPV